MSNFCTLFDQSYLARGLALYNSLKKHLKEFNLYILAMDSESLKVLRNLSLANVVVISQQDFLTAELEKLKKERSRGEFCWTCTPFLLEYCLDKYKLENCTYLDSDIYFFESPKILLDELGQNDVLITEHRYTPKYDQSEVSGRFCVQFLTFKNNENARKVLESWKLDCSQSCELSPEKGLCGDQKYLDKWPSIFENIKILENNGANGPWNINTYFESDKVIFYHFHGLKFYLNLDFELSGPRYFVSKLVYQEIYKPYITELHEINEKLNETIRGDYIGYAKRKTSRKKPKEWMKSFLFNNYNSTRNLVDSISVISCPICNEFDLRITKKNVYDDRFGYSGNYSYLNCKHCEHTWLFQFHTDKTLIDLYSNYYPRSSFNINEIKPNAYSPGLKSWLRGEKASVFTWVPESVKVLDIGCGFGESLLYHKSRGCDVFGVEADENILRVGEKYSLHVKSEILDKKTFKGEKFDVITLDQVVEHSINPNSIFGLLRDYLNKDGVVIFSTPNVSSIWRRLFGKYWLHWHTPYHTQFFSEESLRLVLESNDLSITKKNTVTNSDWLLFQILHIINFPRYGEKSKIWSPTLQEGLMKPLNLTIKVLHRLYISHVIIRIIDFSNLGDNQVFFLRSTFSKED